MGISLYPKAMLSMQYWLILGHLQPSVQCGVGCNYWNGKIMLRNMSSLAALEVVNMTTSSAASDDTILHMTTFLFQWWRPIHVCLQQYAECSWDCLFDFFHAVCWSPVYVFRVACCFRPIRCQGVRGIILLNGLLAFCGIRMILFHGKCHTGLILYVFVTS